MTLRPQFQFRWLGCSVLDAPASVFSAGSTGSSLASVFSCTSPGVLVIFLSVFSVRVLRREGLQGLREQPLRERVRTRREFSGGGENSGTP